MPDNRVYVIKNIARLATHVNGFPIEGQPEEYITRRDSNGVSQPVGFSKEMATSLCLGLSMDPDEAVIVAPDDLVVFIDPSARKLPRQQEQTTLAQWSEGIVNI